MSRENVELHRRLNEAFNTRDAEALVAVCDPAIEVHSVFAAIGGATYTGHDGVRVWLGDIVEAWTDFHVDVECTYAIGEDTLALVVLSGQGSVSGVEVEMPYAQVMRWRDGRCLWFKAYVHREDAFADLGISPGSLEPTGPAG